MFFDLIVLALAVILAVVGMRRGFIKTFFGFFGSLIALALALMLLQPAADFLREHLIQPVLYDFFLRRLSEETLQSASFIDFSALPEGALALFERFGVSPESISAVLAGAGKSVGEELTGELVAMAVSGTAAALSRAAALVVIFSLCALAIRLVANVLDLVSRLPILNFSNRLFGLAAGVLQGLLLAFALSLVLALLEPAFRSSDLVFLKDFSVENTILIRFLAGWNPLVRT